MAMANILDDVSLVEQTRLFMDTGFPDGSQQ